MIRYSLSCPQDHGFESWFQSAQAYDTLMATGHISCPECGATTVTKALMAPSVRPGRGSDARDSEPRPTLSAAPAAGKEAALAELRRQVEANSEYVGVNFVAEARAIHDGDAPERSIYGEARPAEAMQLLQDGIPVAPWPFMPTRKTN